MGLETGTYINDLDVANPPGTDKKKQGDDHLRLIKTVLKNTFPNADRAIRLPEFATKSGTGNILATDENKTLFCDTSGGDFTLTLPTPDFDGWCVKVVKSTTDANCVFVAPPSGNISSNVGAVAKIRVNVAFKEFVFVWTGSAFIEFDGLEEPGTVLSYFAATAPTGYVFTYGQTLAGTNADYPQLFARRATLVMPDIRGRVEFGKDDMGSDAGRLTGIDGDTLGASGGSQTMVQGNFPSGSLSGVSGTFSNSAPGGPANAVGGTPTGSDFTNGTGNSTYVKSNFGAITTQLNTINLGGSSTPLLPPGIVCIKIMRLC